MSSSSNRSASSQASNHSRQWHRVKHLIDEALDLPIAERPAFLEDACDDDALRREAAAFLERDSRLGGFLEHPYFSLRASPTESDEGRRLGPYRLDRKLGSGGMGAVYLARREDGEVRQRVAIKILQRGHDSEALQRRFRTECQILADLDHPYVTRLLDIGTTDDGRPFLVMEYVEGQPIDVYCEARDLSIRQRVELFRRVCEAVQVAHQNFVVHRDLKPANILVTEGGQPKLLDFGIAKLLGRDQRRSKPADDRSDALLPAADSPGMTVPGESPLTYSYASPEQRDGGAITTATDVYALGVVLHKLLTGHLPESSRHPGHGGHGLGGDLGHIVRQALQSDPNLRFSSAEQLSEDLRRHLKLLPVRSRPSTFPYRAGKFVRRHALGVAVTALVALQVLGFGGAMARQKTEIEMERDRSEEFRSLLLGFLESLDPDAGLTAREALESGVEHLRQEGEANPETRAEILDTVGGAFRGLALYEEARPLLTEALEVRLGLYGDDHVLVAETRFNLANLDLAEGKLNQAEAHMRRALTVQRSHRPEGHRDQARGLNNLAVLLLRKEELTEAEALARESLAMKETLYGPDDLENTKPLTTLATVRRKQGAMEEAEELYERCLKLYRRAGSKANSGLASTLNGLAALRVAQDDTEAIPLYAAALAIRRQLYLDDHPKLVMALHNLGWAHIELDHPGSAVKHLEEGLAMARRLAEAGKLPFAKVATVADLLTRAQLVSETPDPIPAPNP